MALKCSLEMGETYGRQMLQSACPDLEWILGVSWVISDPWCWFEGIFNFGLFWTVLEHSADQDEVQWPPPELEYNVFDMCMRGGDRPKRTKLLATNGISRPLGALCVMSRSHSPQGLCFRAPACGPRSNPFARI